MNFPFPSKQLQQGLHVCEEALRKGELSDVHGPWVIMAAGLFNLYKCCHEKQMLDRIFLLDNPFDCAVRRWAMEMDCRERGVDLGLVIDLPSPSVRFQTEMGRNEAILREKSRKDSPTWMLVGGAAIAAYRIHRDDLYNVFDFESAFDQSIHVWCIEAERRACNLNLSRN